MKNAKIAKAKIALAAVLAAVVAASPAAAQFLPTVVHDPANYANAVLRHAQLEWQTHWLIVQHHQLAHTYIQLLREYDHLVRMARQMADKGRYRVPAAPWRESEAADLYGTTGLWSRAVNRGADAAEAYRRAVEELGDYGAALSRIPPDQLDRVKTRYGTVELADAANLHAIRLLGSLRANAALVDRAIGALEDDSLSGRDDANTHIAVLNKINAAGAVAVRSARDTNQLLGALLEQRLAETKRRRDAEAAAVNAHIAFRRHAGEIGLDGVRGSAEVLRNFRLP